MRSASIRGRSWPSTRPSPTSSWSCRSRGEDSSRPPYWPALDIGTGSGCAGASSLAEAAVGGDRASTSSRSSPPCARTRPGSGVEMRLVRGDVTALQEAGMGVDSACSSTPAPSTDSGRPADAMGRELSAVAAAGCHPDPRLLRTTAQRTAPPWRGPRRNRKVLSRLGGQGRGVATDPDSIARLFKFDEQLLSPAAESRSARSELRARSPTRCARTEQRPGGL